MTLKNKILNTIMVGVTTLILAGTPELTRAEEPKSEDKQEEIQVEPYKSLSAYGYYDFNREQTNLRMIGFSNGLPYQTEVLLFTDINSSEKKGDIEQFYTELRLTNRPLLGLGPAVEYVTGTDLEDSMRAGIVWASPGEWMEEYGLLLDLDLFYNPFDKSIESGLTLKKEFFDGKLFLDLIMDHYFYPETKEYFRFWEAQVGVNIVGGLSGLVRGAVNDFNKGTGTEVYGAGLGLEYRL